MVFFSSLFIIYTNFNTDKENFTVIHYSM
uniref:Uncharacterized protein n=1 Tax=Anguilla anguilla TaxID=7936 RepID=A0A0E9QP83_ANGAN